MSSEQTEDKSRIRIVFVVPSLRAGGAEKIMSFVAASLDKTRFEAHLLVIGSSSDSKHKVEDIPIIFLNQKRVLYSAPAIMKSLRKIKPHIVISAISHLNIMMGLISYFFPKTKFVGRETNVMSVIAQVQHQKSVFPNFLMNFFYRSLDMMICQSRDMARDLIDNYNYKPERIVIINNPLTHIFDPAKNSAPASPVKFITVGSLYSRKGHIRILNVLSKLSFDYRYTMVGDGPDSQSIFDTIDELGIREKIVHIPHTDKIAEQLYQSDFFLQGSYVEGFPNALLESCASGTPAICYKAPGGIDEIIEEGVNGLLAESESEYYNQVNKALQIKWDFKEVSKSVTRKYNSNTIIGQYEEFFIRLVE